MKLQILLTLFLQGAVIESVKEISGYLGDTVTLSSGANPSWNLSSIDWSVFSNNTWIATYRNGKKNVNRVDRYKGRLRLNTSSERLTQPIIQTVTCTSAEGGSWLWLRCSSKDTGVNLAWQHSFPSVTLFNMTSPDGNAADLLGFLNTTQNLVEFTCISSRNIEKNSSAVTPNCGDAKPPSPPPHRERNVIVFFVGFFVGVLLVVIIFIFKAPAHSSNQDAIHRI
ncbi:hypothetical protein FQN60_006290 [Etheostoma spectabile]|uniref:Ig-like domain-containing protein n=1 Tax=Etheostoma spectabile TaxID=54343 RepID=A0A5J5CP16_9PERO|nr:hypothetical protein FQN60_006290 [Etheostoma spectabile]